MINGTDGSRTYIRITAWASALIAAVLAIYGLKLTKIVTMPLAFSMLAVMLVYPVQLWVEARVPGRLRWAGILAAMLVMIAALYLFLGGIWLASEELVQGFPKYAEKLRYYWDYVLRTADRYGIGIRESLTGEEKVNENVAGLFTAGLSSVWHLAAVGTIIFFLILLALKEINEWRHKIVSAFEQQKARVVCDAVETITRKLRLYLLVRTIISAISGLLSALWLEVNGVDFAFVWGFLIFLLNYIPYIGSIISVFPPSLMALMQFSFGKATAVIAGLTVIDQVIGNYIEPRLEGWTLVISPFLILISLVLWGWIWGVSGIILAVPFAITLVTACGHIEPLKPVARLLSRPKAYKHNE